MIADNAVVNSTIESEMPNNDFAIVSQISRWTKLKLLLKHLPPRATILEVGTGDGWFAKQLRRHNYSVTTIDLVAAADIQGSIKDWRKLGLQTATFDAVVALEVIEHVDCLADLQALCRPAGLILLSSPHPRFDWLLQIFERIGLLQKRTSPHDHLCDFSQIDMQSVVRRRPLGIHQVGLFRNPGANNH